MSTRELLILQPENLKFHFQLMKQLDCILRLTNTTNEYVAFKVLTTNTSKYCVKPNMGMVPPRLACDTIVTMREQETTPTGVVSKDKFKVKCFMTAPHSTVKDVRTDMFNEGSGNIMEEYKLKVFYELPGHLQPPAPKVVDVDDPSAKMMTQGGEVEAAPREVIEQFSILDINSFDRDCIIKDLEDKLKQKEELINSQRRELEESRQKQNDEQRKADNLTRTVEALENICRAPQYSQFSYVELQQATNDFEIFLKIGEGGYGSVYKGFLRHTTVAIKKLDSQSMQGLPEFYQEVDILTKVRHPNLVNLMGACFSPEPCLVYEFLPNGSLEDRLSCKDNTPPLSWQARIHIITEICSALIFLHSYKPHSVVHGDLKPSNILLDANLVSKLSDFGICRLLTQSSTTTKLHHTEPKGTFPYIDQEFGYTGELTSSSDTYSFGVIILQLLTGRPALGVIKAVQDALTSENLHNILDESAGEWPFLQARRLARLGVECCKMSRRNRPRLETEVWRVLEPMVKASSLEPLSFQLKHDYDSHVPSYFLCPILQEVMKDPQVAADGFTYEAEAIKGWFDGGHNTSPMTNLELPHYELLPNFTLRSVIQEWLQQHYRQ